MAVLAAPAGAAECGWQAGLSGAQGVLGEESRFGEVAEEAFWPGLTLTAAQPVASAGLCLGLDAWAAGGVQGVYEGFTQFGGRHETDVTHTDLGTALFVRQRFAGRFTWRLDTAVERFDRAIEPKGNTGGITENYSWYWLGVGGTWDLCPSCRFPVSLGARHALLLDGKSAVNLFAFGNATIDFDDGRKVRYELVVQPPADAPRLPAVTLSWTKRAFEGTGSFPVIGNTFSVRQPKFNVVDIALGLSWPLR